MCGILGEIDLVAPLCARTFERRLDSLAMRGPDGSGIEYRCDHRVALGHRRLSIIDLSDAGRQPMTNEDGTIWLTFNGEIYNFRDLRRELESYGHRFRSDTDSEVIVHGYEQWADNVVDRLRGIFAFGIWDEGQQRLLLARDHVGVKPLYYWASESGIRFASQPRAIVHGMTPTIDRQALSLFFAYGYVPGDRCIYSGISKLSAGSRLVFQRDQLRVERYWRAEYDPVHDQDSDTVVRVRDSIRDAVTNQMVADVPIGVFLSGGVDSSCITAIASSAVTDKPLSSFTIGFDQPESDERSYAQLVANSLRTEHHVRVLRYEDLLDLIIDFVEAYDEPFYDSSGLPTLAVSALAREHDRKVILSGDGGDEVFAGYHWHDKYLELLGGSSQSGWNRWRRMFPLRQSDVSSPIAQYFGLVGFLTCPQQKTLFANNQWDHISDHLQPLRASFRADIPPITAVQLMDLETYLADDILTKVDRASMARGVEVRVPLLDIDLVNMAFSIPSELIYANGERKSLLKRAVEPWVPEFVRNGRKKGFSIPLRKWMKAGLGEILCDVVCDGFLVDSGILDARRLTKTIHRMPNHCRWLLLAAELWARRWVRGDDQDQIRCSLRGNRHTSIEEILS